MATSSDCSHTYQVSYQPPNLGSHDTQILEPTLPPEPRPSLGHRLFVVLAVVLVIITAGTAAAFAYVQVRLGEVERVDPAGLGGSAEGETILLVGSDSRAGLEPGQESFGTTEHVSGRRSDAIMLLRLKPGGGAAVLSVPRDLWVPIAGTGRSGRINGAYGGGPERLIQTVTQALGVPIDHYVEVNFDGFRSVVDAVGGLNVYFPHPARDGLAELDVPASGCVALTGSQGLAFVRSRQYESFQDGRWRRDPTGDFGRIERQQDFIRRMLSKAVSRGVRNPLVANDLLEALVQNVTFDRDLGALDLVRLGWAMRSLDSGSLEMMTLPTVGAGIAGVSALKTQEPEATEVLNRFMNPPPADSGAAVPAEVRVRVLNGSGREGEAGLASDALTHSGFDVIEVGDARSRVGNTVVSYADGALAKAELVAGYIGGATDLRAEPTLSDVDVELVTGGTFAGVQVPGGDEPPAGQPPADTPAEAAPVQPECLP